LLSGTAQTGVDAEERASGEFLGVVVCDVGGTAIVHRRGFAVLVVAEALTARCVPGGVAYSIALEPQPSVSVDDREDRAG
jgi:hypothetical protein